LLLFFNYLVKKMGQFVALLTIYFLQRKLPFLAYESSGRIN
jgi:hypothetical protein